MQLRHLRPLSPEHYKKKWKRHTSSSHADVRRSISTKFYMMIEVVRAVIFDYENLQHCEKEQNWV